jgi:hypothetical protein
MQTCIGKSFPYMTDLGRVRYASSTPRRSINVRFTWRWLVVGRPGFDPKEPVAVFWANDQSTLELDLRRSRRANLSW